MNKQKRLPRPVRDARKLKTGTVTISYESWDRARIVAREYGIRPELVLGIVVAYMVAGKR